MKKLLFISSIIALFFSGCTEYPDANFAVNKTTVQPGEYIQFTNYSDNAIKYEWDFGDGTYSTDINPRHSYSSEGTYTITLTAEGRHGKIDRVSLNIAVIIVYPYADFSVDRTTVQPGEYVQFTNYSENAISYKWDFDDGTFSTALNPAHSFTDEGIYSVSLTAYGQNGNYDIAYITIEVIYTELEIEVAEWNEYNIIQFIVDDCGVWVYDNLNEWLYDDGSGAIISGYTGYDGKISFLGLDDRSYYIYVEKTDAYGYIIYDNYNIYQDFGTSYITTQRLVPYQYNYWLAWADYYGNKRISRVNQDIENKNVKRAPRMHKNRVSKIKIRTNTL